MGRSEGVDKTKKKKKKKRKTKGAMRNLSQKTTRKKGNAHFPCAGQRGLSCISPMKKKEEKGALKGEKERGGRLCLRSTDAWEGKSFFLDRQGEKRGRAACMSPGKRKKRKHRLSLDSWMTQKKAEGDLDHFSKKKERAMPLGDSEERMH